MHPAWIRYELAPCQRQCLVANRKETMIELGEGPREQDLIWRPDDDDAARLGRRVASIVEIVTVDRHERARELSGELEVTPIVRAAKVVVLDHEKDIPSQIMAHERDDAGRNIGVGIDPRGLG